MTLRQGILTVSTELVGRAARALPPEHRIVATRDLPDARMVEWLVEGPLLPEVIADAQPRHVEFMPTLRRNDDGGLRMTGEFLSTGSRSAEWEIGRWPDWEAMQAFLNRPC